MDMNVVYKIACRLISKALHGWAIQTQGGVEFANYIEGIIALVDALELENDSCECEEEDAPECDERSGFNISHLTDVLRDYYI